jgi:uncharacterized protein DUF2795
VVERGSTHHSPRMDDELERETESLVRGSPVESRAEEWRQQEGPAEGEPGPDAHVSVDDIELRSLLAISLRPSAFPGNRDRLVTVAQEERAEDRVLGWLQSLPADVEFVNVEQVWEALGGEYERRDNSSLMMPEPIPEAPVEPQARPRPRAKAPTVARTEPAPAQPEQPEHAPALLERVCGVARTGVEIAVGLAIQTVQEVRKRLPG